MPRLITRLITQSKQATAEQLAQIITQVSQAPFAVDLLEVDEPLWGDFWQGDVIAPGYRLPAVELALLRAIRLDLAWPEGTTVAEFLADLQGAILDPQAGVWVLMAAGEPCVVFASVRGQGSGVRGQISSINDRPTAISDQPSATVVWYCATTGQLHAGYRTAIDNLNFEGAVEQRPPVIPSLSGAKNPHSLHSEEIPTSGQAASFQEYPQESLGTRLDVEILRIRYHGS